MDQDFQENQSPELHKATSFGVDVHQLRANLELSFEERAMQHAAALELFEECLKSYHKRYGKIHPADQNS